MNDPEIVKLVPNGGVLMLRISDETNTIQERLVFLRPDTETIIPFKLTTDKDDYQPGDKVSIEIEVTPQEFNEEESFHASVVVTDVSSFLEVPKH